MQSTQSLWSKVSLVLTTLRWIIWLGVPQVSGSRCPSLYRLHPYTCVHLCLIFGKSPWSTALADSSEKHSPLQGELRTEFPGNNGRGSLPPSLFSCAHRGWSYIHKCREGFNSSEIYTKGNIEHPSLRLHRQLTSHLVFSWTKLSASPSLIWER